MTVLPRPGRLAVGRAGLLAVGVAAVLYVAGRLHQPDYTFSMFGADPFPPKSALATIALVLAGLQVLLALWISRMAAALRLDACRGITPAWSMPYT